ncbi:MAG: hypothetical protein ABIJ00_01360, partial [Candidatus Eisenbacteria bacterium]
MAKVILSASTILLLTLIWAGGAGCAESDSVIAVAPFDLMLTSSDLDSYPGLVISPEALLVILPEPRAGTLLAAGAVTILGSEPRVPLWIVPGEVPEDVAGETGVAVRYTTQSSTVVEADRASADRLRSRGYFVVKAKFRPVADLKQPHFGSEAVEQLLRKRPLTGARTRFMRSLSDSVDTLLIKSTLFDLTYDVDLGDYRSRYACRIDLNRDIAPYIEDRL